MSVKRETSTVERLQSCESSACDGSYVCSKPKGHAGDHECREFGHAARLLWTDWTDADADDEPYWCAHEEDEHRSAAQPDLVTCTRCGSVRMVYDDPNGTTWLETIRPRTRRKVSYSCAICGVRECRGCPPPPVLRGWAS